MASGAGFDQAELARMHDTLAGHVEHGLLPGCITLVAHRGDVHIDVVGTKAFGDAEPMPRDAIFRITSLSKPWA